MRIYNLIKQDKKDGDVSCETFLTHEEAVQADKRTRLCENSWIVESELEIDEDDEDDWV